MNNILVAVLALGGLGLLFGVGLAIASKAFHVAVDLKVEEIKKLLPGANCGACGYPGCEGLAEAIAKGYAPPNACPVGGEETTEGIAGVMGVDAEASDRQVARVICNGTTCNAVEKFEYDGLMDCRAAALVGGGNKSCSYGCLGYGSCYKVCDFGAITIEDGIAKIDKDKCTACGRCLEVCPKDVIDMVPYKQEVVVECNSNDRGKAVKESCKVGCIGCQICVKACPHGAMEFKDGLAYINYDKCTDCRICAEKCPTKAIYARLDEKKVAKISKTKCVGCTVCAKHCPVHTIEGYRDEVHQVVEENCIGCGICVKKCSFNAIEMEYKTRD